MRREGHEPEERESSAFSSYLFPCLCLWELSQLHIPPAFSPFEVIPLSQVQVQVKSKESSGSNSVSTSFFLTIRTVTHWFWCLNDGKLSFAVAIQ